MGQECGLVLDDTRWHYRHIASPHIKLCSTSEEKRFKFYLCYLFQAVLDALSDIFQGAQTFYSVCLQASKRLDFIWRSGAQAIKANQWTVISSKDASDIVTPINSPLIDTWW